LSRDLSIDGAREGQGLGAELERFLANVLCPARDGAACVDLSQDGYAPATPDQPDSRNRLLNSPQHRMEQI